jgi:hypothetical protein
VLYTGPWIKKVATIFVVNEVALLVVNETGEDTETPPEFDTAA